MKPDGGSAFPCQARGQDGLPTAAPEFGMTLLDYFAAKAMQVEIETACRSVKNAKALVEEAERSGMTIEERIAFNAYAMADAMIVERGRGTRKP